MQINQLLNETVEHPTTVQEFMDIMKDFLPLAMQELKIKNLPHIKLEKYIKDSSQPTFGKYVNDENTIHVGIENRHPLDVMRTLAHELVHFKQGQEDRLDATSGETGSPIENEAHELAGIIMRHFGKRYPHYFTDTAITLSESEAWQKSSGKNKNGGLNKKGVKSYRASHPGSHLKTAVTTKPSKLKKGSKASKRRKSFCARMKGMKKHRTGAKTKHDPNSRINKSLRKWHCESVGEMQDLILVGSLYIDMLKENFADGKNPGRKGLAKRSGVNTKASVSSLRNTAKHSSGEKARMSHWLANMKAGKAKAKK
jgi:hypothetical protein